MDKALDPNTGDIEPAVDNPEFQPVNTIQSQPVPTNHAADNPATTWPSPSNQMTNHMHSNVNVNVAMPAIHMSMQSSGTPFIVRAIWFVFVGWWLSGLVIAIGYLCLLSIFLMPLGFWFLNRVPQAQTLKSRKRTLQTEFKDGAIFLTESRTPQHPWYYRALYLVFVGWWAGLIWLSLAWALAILIITLPLSVWMVDRSPQVITLQKN